jgi:exopolysaccharide biosynthesis predicted pyruvyltransferase EpsI
MRYAIREPRRDARITSPTGAFGARGLFVSRRYRTVLDLRAALQDVLSGVISRGSRVALLDFPAHTNVGDLAIWLGEIAMLRALDCRVVYVCDRVSYSREALEARLPAGSPVLLHGGGNFGDLWPKHQRFRERVIEELPGRTIIQLPVSLHFRSETAAHRARETLNRHERLTFLFRDRESLAYARDHYVARSLLCPDTALALTPDRRARPDTDIVMLQRSDKERLERLAPLSGARVLDWLSEPGEPGYSRRWEQRARVATWIGRARPGGASAERLRQAVIGRLFNSLARDRVAFGYAVTSSGRVLVTDRLHGHILALLLGVPHVVVETGYGKIRSFYESFSHEIESATLCTDPADVEPAVRRLLTAASAQG